MLSFDMYREKHQIARMYPDNPYSWFLSNVLMIVLVKAFTLF